MKLFGILIGLFFQAAVLTTQAASLNSLYSFTGGSDGQGPRAALMQATDGNFYGSSDTVLFRETPGGVFSVLATLSGSVQGPLVQGPDGALYGTTYLGGTAGKGSIFKVTTNGVLTTLYSLTGGADGANCAGGLILASDGAFYGSTARGANGYGTIFRVTTNGTLTTIYTFTGGADGGIPRGELVQGSDGMLYGAGGLMNPTYKLPYMVYKLSTAGAFTLLHTFVNTEGVTPNGGLVEMPDGNFYGTAGTGGANGFGSIFAVSPTGAFVVWSLPNSGSTGSVNPLAKGVDGNLYGTIRARGSYNLGLLYRFTTNGTFTELYSFSGGIDGSLPVTPLLQGRDGDFYGTTSYGGVYSCGTLFRFNVFSPPNATTQPATQIGGSTATLNGIVNPSGLASTAFFVWGTTSDYGNRTAPTAQGAGSGDVAVGALLTNLTPGTTYHFSIVASNLYGMVTMGGDQVFTTTPLPTISSFSPTTGAAGSSVTISGTHFTGASNVLLSGEPALFTVVSDTEITAAVPRTASGPISVTTGGGTTVTTSNFNVLIWPTISGISPASGSPGTTITITGSHLENVTNVAFNAVPASFIGGPLALMAVVPDCAGNGFITATSPGGTATSPSPFAVVVVKPALTLTNCDPVALSGYLCGGGTVNFACSGTIVLSNTLVITADTTLDGTGQSLTLSGNNLNRVLSVNPGVKLTLRNITLSNGRDSMGTGGALFNDGGIVAASDCTFSFNSATCAPGDAFGGAIYNDLWGRLTLERCTFFNNSVLGSPGTQGTYPGGAGGAGGNGYGGALCNNGGSISITNCTFSENQSIGGNGGQGGQGQNGYYYSCGFGGTCFSPPGMPGNGGSGGNAFGGNIYNTTNNTVFSGTIVINSATIANGVAYGGSGGMGGPPGNYGMSWGNSGAPGNGLGGNFGLGNSALGMPNVSVFNTLIANSAYGVNCWGNLGDAGYNASSDWSCNFTSTNSHGGWAMSLGSLTNNGGATMTLSLSSDSPAMNAGASNAPSTDQRGLPRMVFGVSDIGAFEVQNSLFLTLQGDSSMTNECHAQFIDPGIVASNFSGADLSGSVVVGGFVDTNNPGTYSLTYSLTDGVLTNFVTRLVTVVDTTPPVLTLLGPSAMTNECHSPWSDPGATATDLCVGGLSVQVTGTVNTNSPGNYSLVYSATDSSGNTTQSVRQMVVVDTQLPTLTLLGANPMMVPCESGYVEPGAIAADLCSGDLNGSIIISGTVANGVPGHYTRSYSVTDGSGNTANAQREVIVLAAVQQQTMTLVEDTFDGTAGSSPDPSKFDWSGDVALNGVGQLDLSTWSANTSWIKSKATAVITQGKILDLQVSAYAYAEGWYPGIYGDGQPRGLRVGTDANNVVEFYSVACTTVGMRTRLNGSETLASYSFPAGVDSIHQYQITVSSTGAVFRLDGVLAGIITSNIPTNGLNFHAATFDGYAGNVPARLDSMQLSLTSAISGAVPEAPSGLIATAVSSGQIDLTWSDNSTNETGFLVERQIGAGAPWTLLATLGTNTTRYRADSIMPDVINYFRVSACNDVGPSASAPLRVEPELLGPGTVMGWGETGWNLISIPANLSNVVMLAGGYYGSLALNKDGTVRGWGMGLPGNSVPTDLSNIVAVAGNTHGLALKSDGTVEGWGDDYYLAQVPPGGLSNVVAISAGEHFSEALKNDGTVVAWGWGGFGQTAVPDGLSNVVAISAGGKHTLALRSDRRITTWGDNRFLQCNVPAAATNIIAVAAGYWHSLALRADSTVVGWGQNTSGEATPPAGLSNVIAIAAGNGFSLALQRNGTVLGWGYNMSGTGQASPPDSLGMVSAISAGYMHSLGVQSRFAITQLPFIASFSPTNGSVGTPVAIHGNHLSTTASVALNGTPMGFSVVSDSQLTVTVPAGATSGLITLTNSIGDAISALRFHVFSPVTDFSYTTNNGAITITGYTGPGGAVAIPDTISGMPVTVIGNNAFYNRYSLTAVIIPNSVTTIGSQAFYSCGSLASAVLGSAVVSIGTSAFQSCTFSNVIIPGSVTSIGGYAFSYCTKLTSICLPTNATSLGANLLYYCPSLTNITVVAPNPVCASLDGVLFDQTGTALIQFPGGRTGSYTIPDGVTSISSRAFAYCKLTSVSVPSSVTSIGTEAFDACANLTAINVDLNNLSYSSVNGALLDKAKITLLQVPGATISYAVPNGVQSISAGAFSRCANLTEVTLPTSLTNIGSSAFGYCSRLTRITFPAGLASIGDYAFYASSGLGQVYFQGNAPGFGSTAFGATSATFYYLPRTDGWEAITGGRPTALWNPVIQPGSMHPEGFSFTVTGTANIPFVMEACTQPDGGVWMPVVTNTLANGSFLFNDSAASNYPIRFYRIRSPL